MKILVIFIFFLFNCRAAASAECPASHFDFVGKYALGKQDELNKTFSKIMEKM
jgi:hypothetical protein